MREERLEAREERDAASSSLSSGTMNSSSSSDALERRAVNKSSVKGDSYTCHWMDSTFFLRRLLKLAQGLREGRCRSVLSITFHECVIFQCNHASLLCLP